MDLLIPKTNDDWVVSKNTIYIRYVAKIPVLTKRGDDIWVFLDAKVIKYVIKIVSHLESMNIKFLFRSSQMWFDKEEDEMHRLNIDIYLRSITNPRFFDGFIKTGFDFSDNLSDYLVKYNCFDIFSEVYKKANDKAMKKYHDYWTNSHIYYVEREDIRNYISSLERDIKIGLLF